jgi:ferric-dicitrate binding protein FerR (iron transport regulator)
MIARHPYPTRRERRSVRRRWLADIALCLLLGSTLAAIVVHGWAGGFRTSPAECRR